MTLTLQSQHQRTSAMEWFTKERRMWLAACGLCALAGGGYMNGHTTQSAVSHISDQLGQKTVALKKTQTVVVKLQAANNCEGARANKATQIAKDAIKGALSISDPIPSTSDLPKDNCIHTPVHASGQEK